ncbi:hypothetical protein BAMBUS_00110 [Brevundimonas phage vB_BpoS-Bambus]|nr:hypothetical protein BAMBUS_00110 [Brevundimonas phage vB_BpoS-Bambus]
MSRAYTISISVVVTNPRELFDAALQQWRRDNPSEPVGEPDCYSDYIGTRTAPNIDGCLRSLADPGVSWPGTQIEDSSTEQEPSFGDDESEPEPDFAFAPGDVLHWASTCPEATTPPYHRVEVIRPLDEDEAVEVGPAYRVKDDAGVEYDAFEDELTPIP